jgi:hypothetical protein
MGSYVSVVRLRSKNRVYDFDLDANYLWQLYLNQNKKCALSGLDIFFNSTSRSGDGNASLDRKDSNKGYTKENVQWVHKDINRIKWELEEKYFLSLVESIYKHRIQNENKLNDNPRHN